MELQQRIKNIKQQAETIARLPVEQVFKRPTSVSWSAAECLDHLFESNELYFRIFDEILAGKYKQTFWQKISPFTDSIGKNMINTLGQEVKQKFKSPKLFLPNRNPKPDVSQRFIGQQDQLISYVDGLKDPKYTNLVVSSPAATLITIKLKDALEIITGHEERHLKQALRAIDAVK